MKWFREYPLFRRWGLYRLGLALIAAALAFGVLDSAQAQALGAVLAAVLLIADRNVS